MKTMKKNLTLPLILLIGLAGLSIQCSDKKVNPIAPAQLEKTLRLYSTSGTKRTVTGLVRDLKTGQQLPNAKVTVIDSTLEPDVIIASGYTDGTGKFEISGIPIDTFLVYISKSGYIDATLTAFVRDYYWSVHLKTTFLIPLAKEVTIGASGGFIEDTDEEGDVIRLDIPPDALNANVGITLTHLQGMEIPSYPPKGHLSLATANLGPDGTVFNKSATMTIPLPKAMQPGSEMPLYTLNITDPVFWQGTGIKATVNPGGLTASAPITRAALYSVMPAVKIQDIAVDTLWEQMKVLPSASGFFTVTYKNQYNNTAPEYVYFPDGAMAVNHSTLIYMFEQYYGVPFTEPETETIFYESPTGFYPYQLIRVLSLEGEMILPDPTADVNFKVFIKRPAVRFVPHDQGCGY
jgi:hypothetical protein